MTGDKQLRQAVKALAKEWRVSAKRDEERLMFEPGISLDDRILLPTKIETTRTLAEELRAVLELS